MSQYHIFGLEKNRVKELLNNYLSADYPVMFLPILMDEPRLVEELDQLPFKLKKILWYSAFYCIENFGIPLTLTHIFRTQKEQDDIYGDREKYKNNPWKSPHQEYRAADARLRDMGVKNAKELADHINELFPYDEQSSYPTVIVHDVGLGNHIHFQVKKQ